MARRFGVGSDVIPKARRRGSGGTATDLARVLRAILKALRGDDDAIVPEPLARRMVTPVDGQSALGLFVGPYRTISHGGRNIGFDAGMVAHLDTGRIRAAVTNQNGALELYAPDLVAG